MNDEFNILTYSGSAVTYGYTTTTTTSYSLPYNLKIPIKLPESFEKVIKKFIIEIRSIKPIDCGVTYFNNGYTNSLDKVVIKLLVNFDYRLPKNYEEEINDLFKMTFPEFGFVKFSVVDFGDGGNEMIDRFINIFGK